VNVLIVVLPGNHQNRRSGCVTENSGFLCFVHDTEPSTMKHFPLKTTWTTLLRHLDGFHWTCSKN